MLGKLKRGGGGWGHFPGTQGSECPGQQEKTGDTSVCRSSCHLDGCAGPGPSQEPHCAHVELCQEGASLGH